MTTYSWAELRENFSRQVGGETPGNQLEEKMIVTFRENPNIIALAMETVVTTYQKGGVHSSSWGLLDKRIGNAIQTEDVYADDKAEKQRAIKRAETWMKHSGIHYDRESEITAELFERGGILEPFAEDQALETRMTALWREARPTGEQIEQADREADALFADRHKCARCGKLRPFLLAPCPHCQFHERMVSVFAQLGEEPAHEPAPQPDPDEEPL